MILLGNTIYALAIVMFILPNNMITGGTTGLGIAIHHYFGLPIHSFVLLFNTLMFLLGAAVLGMKFALTTLVSTFYYPVILGVLEQMPALQNVTDDKMLSTICGGDDWDGDRRRDPVRSLYRRNGYSAAGSEQEVWSSGICDAVRI